jgi:hypothetical protein
MQVPWDGLGQACPFDPLCVQILIHNSTLLSSCPPAIQRVLKASSTSSRQSQTGERPWSVGWTSGPFPKSATRNPMRPADCRIYATPAATQASRRSPKERDGPDGNAQRRDHEGCVQHNLVFNVDKHQPLANDICHTSILLLASITLLACFGVVCKECGPQTTCHFPTSAFPVSLADRRIH